MMRCFQKSAFQKSAFQTLETIVNKVVGGTARYVKAKAVDTYFEEQEALKRKQIIGRQMEEDVLMLVGVI